MTADNGIGKDDGRSPYDSAIRGKVPAEEEVKACIVRLSKLPGSKIAPPEHIEDESLKPLFPGPARYERRSSW